MAGAPVPVRMRPETARLAYCATRAAAFVDTFDGGENHGGWSLSGRGTIVESDDRGAYLHETFLATHAPLAMTDRQVASRFTGDYRARNVVAVSAELEIFSVNLTTRQRPMSVVLISDPGTPRDASDDLYVFQVGRRNIPNEHPREDVGWVTYELDIPSQSPMLPFPRSEREGEPGWVIAQGDLFTPPVDPDAAWNAAIQDVDQVLFWFHDPRYFAFLQDWNLALDNPTIVTCAP